MATELSWGDVEVRINGRRVDVKSLSLGGTTHRKARKGQRSYPVTLRLVRHRPRTSLALVLSECHSYRLCVEQC
jgi:hypothetical protein